MKRLLFPEEYHTNHVTRNACWKMIGLARWVEAIRPSSQWRFPRSTWNLSVSTSHFTNCLPYFYETKAPKLGFSCQRKLTFFLKQLSIFRRKRKVTAKQILVLLGFHTQKANLCLWFEGLCIEGKARAKGRIKHDPTSRSHQLNGDNKMCALMSKMQN